MPIVRIIEGSGGGGSVKTIETKGRANLPGQVGETRSYHLMTDNLGHIPVVGLGLGSVAGLGAARFASTHYSVMTKGSAMFVAGPPVVSRLGQEVGKQDLGGWEIQTRSGAVDHAVDTEDEAFACARKFLSHLPSSVHELPPVIASSDPVERPVENLMKAVPRNLRQVYKMRPIIETVVDQGSFFEMGQMYGRSIITGFRAARRQARGSARQRSLPLRRRVDFGSLPEDRALRRHGADLPSARRLSLRLPRLHDRQAGGGIRDHPPGRARDGGAQPDRTSPGARSSCAIVSASPAQRISPAAGFAALCLAFRALGLLPLEGGIEAAYRADIEGRRRSEAKLAEIEERLNKLRSPFRTAEKFWVEDIIDPRETRKLLCDFANLAQRR